MKEKEFQQTNKDSFTEENNSKMLEAYPITTSKKKAQFIWF
jgi:hypothetical protein